MGVPSLLVTAMGNYVGVLNQLGYN